jgi:polysaccharide deacetylase family protein (PEP-CTERM system associated)
MRTIDVPNALTIDVEDWFHILDNAAVPPMDDWASQPSYVEGNTARVLDLLSAARVKATFFWLGWIAERHKSLIRRCTQEGHEIASHGYAHLLPCKAGEERFRADIIRAKDVLEDVSGREVAGFRAAGFGITEAEPWAFDVIRKAGYLYDASVFPAHHGHGGLLRAPLVPHFIETRSGALFEIPMSVAELCGRRFGLFGGGYLRLAPKWMIKWGVARLQAHGRPLVVYVHPRDIDPDQPRLPLPWVRRFKCYVNLHTTFGKLKWLCQNYRFGTMRDLMDAYLSQVAMEAETVPVPSRVCPGTKLRHAAG